jgi:hypothetical protein
MKHTKLYYYDLYSPAIFAGLRTLKGIGNEKGSGRAKFKEFVGRGIRYYTEMWEPTHYSTSAKNFCDERGIDINTLPHRSYSKIVGGEPNKPSLVLEHTTPISYFIESMLVTDEARWALRLQLYGQLCWVTREEDDTLNLNGFRHKRPDGWVNCYNHCGIEVNQFNRFKENLNFVKISLAGKEKSYTLALLNNK